MAGLVLDSGAVTFLAGDSSRVKALLAVLMIEDAWPPVVPSAVLVECLTGDRRRDARTNRFLKACDIATRLDESTARHAARLRNSARRGSAVDAIVVALTEPGGVVITGDVKDIGALAANADGVRMKSI